MSLNASMIQAMVDKGLTAQDIADIAKAGEAKIDRTAAERQARYRDKKRGKSNAVTSRRNPPIEDIHTPTPDISSDDESQDTAGDECAQVVSAWNGMAAKTDLSAVSTLSDKRRRSLRARLCEHGLPAILQAIDRIPKSAFLRGETGNWNGAKFEFFIRPDTITKILEGSYDDRPKHRNPQQTAPRNRDGVAAALDRRIGFDDAAGSPDRRTIGDGRSDGGGTVAYLAAMR